MKKQKYVPNKRTRQTQKKKNFNEMEVRNLPDKEFKLMVIKVLINKNG